MKYHIMLQMLCLSDLVLNHTANETPWLKTNPECAFNLQNSVHLRPAYLMDALLAQFSMDVAKNKFADQGLPAELNSEKHLTVRYAIFIEK